MMAATEGPFAMVYGTWRRARADLQRLSISTRRCLSDHPHIIAIIITAKRCKDQADWQLRVRERLMA